MAQPPPDQNFYHHHPHHPHAHTHNQLPPQFRNPFDLLFDERTGAINYNYIRPYIPNQLQKSNDLSDALVMRRPRRTRTTFTSAQIAELEQHFLQGRYLTSSRLAELSNKLALGTAQVKIWFKNRRRRHKIQSDQQKDQSIAFSCDNAELSPTPMQSNKTKPRGAIGAPPNIQTLNLGSSGGSTPTTLTPSPTPTTPTPNLMEHYGDSYNSYYYNNTHHGVHLTVPPATPHNALNPQANARAAHYQPPHPALTACGTTQFFAPPSATLQQLRHQQHHHHSQQHHQHQQYQPQYHSHRSHHQYDFHQKLQAGNSVVAGVKKDIDYNYNNSYYVRMSSAATAALSAPTPTASSKVVDDAMSSNSEIYEPLTPKNDESPSLYNGGDRVRGSAMEDIADEMDETNEKSLQVLLPNRAEVCKNEISGGTNSAAINILEDCNGAFSKYSKMSVDNHDSNYQCTMDTLIAYRNPSSNAQFAYCFN